MRRNEVGLLLVALSLILFWVAIGLRSWWVVGLGLGALVASLTTPGRAAWERVLPMRAVIYAAAALLVLIVVNALLTTLGPRTRDPGQGITLTGEWLAVAATLILSLAALTVLAVFWLGVWRLLEEDREPWQARTYLAALGVFVFAPALFLSTEFAATPSPEASAYRLNLVLGLVSLAVAGAAALPHLDRATLDAWRAGRSPPAAPADDSGNT